MTVDITQKQRFNNVEMTNRQHCSSVVCGARSLSPSNGNIRRTRLTSAVAVSKQMERHIISIRFLISTPKTVKSKQTPKGTKPQTLWGTSTAPPLPIFTSDKGGGKCVCSRFVCLSICLSVCEQDYSKTRAWIWMKCCVSTDVRTWTN